MKNHDSRPFFILALNFAADDVSDELDYLASQFSGTIKQVQGCYCGDREHSYIIDVTDYETELPLIKNLAKKNNQEAFVYVDNQRYATIYFDVDGVYVPEYAGQFKSTDASVAQRRCDFTFDKSTATYWVIT